MTMCGYADQFTPDPECPAVTARQPIYHAEGGRVVAKHTRRSQTPEVARTALGYLIEDALSCDPALLDMDLRMIREMVCAIREAEAQAAVQLERAAA